MGRGEDFRFCWESSWSPRRRTEGTLDPRQWRPERSPFLLSALGSPEVGWAHRHGLTSWHPGLRLRTWRGRASWQPVSDWGPGTGGGLPDIQSQTGDLTQGAEFLTSGARRDWGTGIKDRASVGSRRESRVLPGDKVRSWGRTEGTLREDCWKPTDPHPCLSALGAPGVRRAH